MFLEFYRLIFLSPNNKISLKFLGKPQAFSSDMQIIVKGRWVGILEALQTDGRTYAFLKPRHTDYHVYNV